MAAPVTLRSVGPSVFLPTLLYGTGEGAIAPIVALTARDMGASVSVAALIVGMVGIGRLVGDVPAGALTARIGERNAMLLATGLVAAALGLVVVTTTLWVMALAIACTGLAGSVWGLARQSYLTEAMPVHLRARALSTLGGSNRIGQFIGPFLGAAAVAWFGIDGAYWVHIVAAGGAALLLLTLPDVSKHRDAARLKSGGVLRVARTHLPVLRTLGVANMLVGAVRISRQAIIPLWGEHIGLDSATVAVLFGLSGGVDMLLFYPAGKVMDRYGRIWMAVPSMLVLGVAFLLLPLTGSALSLGLVGLLMGLGNGLGSGLIMTLGADASPSVGRPEFLGVWRLCTDTGQAGGPLLLSAVATVAGLAPAALVMGTAGLVGALAMYRWVPRRVPTSQPQADQPS